MHFGSVFDLFGQCFVVDVTYFAAGLLTFYSSDLALQGCGFDGVSDSDSLSFKTALKAGQKNFFKLRVYFQQLAVCETSFNFCLQYGQI